jgi:hypothetical protein
MTKQGVSGVRMDLATYMASRGRGAEDRFYGDNALEDGRVSREHLEAKP